LADLRWREGSSSSNGDQYTRLGYAQLSDGFVTVGGYDADIAGYVRTVVKFDENLYEWTSLGELMAIERGLATAVAVPDTFLQCS